MTIQSFANWSSSNGRSQSAPLSILKGATVGIDGAHYLDKVLSQNIKEPLVNALGGQPFGLQDALTNDLNEFQKAGIKPIFVFAGCSIVRTEKPFSTPDESAKGRVKAWEIYDQRLGDKAVEAFGATGTGPVQDRFRIMMRQLRESNVEFQVAPYASWPQLAYLEKHEYVDAVWGPNELILWDVDKIIVDIDLNVKKNFTFVSKQRLRLDIHLSPEQFTDACLLSGSQLCRTFPPLEAGNPNAVFLEAVNLVKRSRTVGNAIAARDQQNVYLDKFRKARAAIKHHVIMKEDGAVEQLDLAESPSDVHEFIGQRLPDELYFYLSRGIIGPQVLEMLTTGELIIPAPLDCSESETYKKFLLGLETMRTEALSMVTKPLVRYWSARDVKVYYWHDPQRPRTLSPKEVVPPSDKAQKWNVKDAVFGPAMDTQNKDWGELAFCITSLDDESYAAKTITPKNPTNLLVTQDEIRISALYRMLQLRGFIDGETHKLTPWGRALNKAIRVQDTEDEGVIIPLFIAMELYRMKVLKSDNFFPNCSGQPSNGTDEEKKFVTLISRVASLVAIAHKPVGYTGPLSRDLLAFTGFSRTLTKELRNYLEMVLVNLLMAGDADREDRKDWGALGLKLPFINDTGAALGVAVKTYLDNLCAEDDPTSSSARDRVMKQVEGMFQQCEDVAIDIEIAFCVFDALVASVKSLAADGIMADEAKEFVAAAKWLGTRRTFVSSGGLWSDE